MDTHTVHPSVYSVYERTVLRTLDACVRMIRKSSSACTCSPMHGSHGELTETMYWPVAS